MASTIDGDVVLWDEEFRVVVNENRKHTNSIVKFIYIYCYIIHLLFSCIFKIIYTNT